MSVINNLHVSSSISAIDSTKDRWIGKKHAIIEATSNNNVFSTADNFISEVEALDHMIASK